MFVLTHVLVLRCLMYAISVHCNRTPCIRLTRSYIFLNNLILIVYCTLYALNGKIAPWTVKVLEFDKLRWALTKTAMNYRLSSLTKAHSGTRVALSNERNSARPDVVTRLVRATSLAMLAIHALESIANIILAKLVALVRAVDTSVAVDALVIEAVVSSSVSRGKGLATASPSLEGVV